MAEMWTQNTNGTNGTNMAGVEMGTQYRSAYGMNTAGMGPTYRNNIPGMNTAYIRPADLYASGSVQNGMREPNRGIVEEEFEEFDEYEDDIVVKNEKSTKKSKTKDYWALLVNTILGLVITCIVLSVITIVSLCLAISAKHDINEIYNYSGQSIVENEEDLFYFDGENFVGGGTP